jgi:hypothetical protein
MKKLLRVVVFGTLLISCVTPVVSASENISRRENDPTRLDQIVPANRHLVSSYRDLSPSYFEPSPLPIQGLAMYYNPGVMDRVLQRQIGWGHVTECSECIGRVALLREGDMDRRIWLQRPGHAVEGPFWVVDQAAERDVPGLVRRNWAVDVDYETAMRWKMRGPIPIIVLAAPSQAVPVTAESITSEETARPAIILREMPQPTVSGNP